MADRATAVTTPRTTSLEAWQPPSLPYGLNDWLDRESSAWPTGLTIRPAIRAVLPAIIERFRQGLEPHEPQAFESGMMALAVVFPNNRASAAELSARIRTYSIALEDIPSDLVELACKRAIRNCEHFPKPAELRTLIADDLTERRRRLNRAMMIARLPDAPDIKGDIDRQSDIAALVATVAAAKRVTDA